MGLLALLGACAPTVQTARPIPADFAGPRLDDDRLVSFDTTPLGLTVWEAEGGEPWAVVVGLHGVNDYARTFEGAGPVWAARGITTYAYDARGHGRSPNRGVWGGQDLMTADLRAAVRAVRARHPNALLAVVGESMGAATIMAAATGGEGLPGVDRHVLVAPAVWGWRHQPLPYRVTLWLGAHSLPRKALTPPRVVTNRIRASDNEEMLRALGRDPLMIWGSRLDTLCGLVSLMETATDAAPRLPSPTLFLYGSNDQIVPRHAVTRTVRRLPPHVRHAEYPDGWHMMLRDRQAPTLWTDIEAFLRNPAAPLPSGVGPVQVKRR